MVKFCYEICILIVSDLHVCIAASIADVGGMLQTPSAKMKVSTELCHQQSSVKQAQSVVPLDILETLRGYAVAKNVLLS